MMDPLFFDTLVFDADDTLWDCQGHFDRVEQACCDMLSPWADAATVRNRLYATEEKNMPLLGYGCLAFTHSVIENAISLSHGEIAADDIARLQRMGYSLLRLPATPLPGVESTLGYLREKGRWKMVVFTKGDLLDQEGKLDRSGLRRFFDDILIVSNKDESAYRDLCTREGISPDRLLMIGNSFKSDIEPALRIGGWAIHIPFHITWQHESVEEFSHERLTVLQHFDELKTIF